MKFLEHPTILGSDVDMRRPKQGFGPRVLRNGITTRALLHIAGENIVF
jgi:hypothetical protein